MSVPAAETAEKSIRWLRLADLSSGDSSRTCPPPRPRVATDPSLPVTDASAQRAERTGKRQSGKV